MLDVDVRRRLGDFALDAVFTCPTDGIVAFFGRSGAGKTTLVNMVAGLLRPDEGRIAINGTVVFESGTGIDLPPERRRLGYVFQEGRLFPHLSVRSNLTYGYRRAPRGDHKIEFDHVVALLGLERLLARRPHDLSGGEKQRVALGRALLANPRLLLMDEPLAALDQARKEEVLPFIERLRDELAIPIIYVSHSMPELVRLADTMVLVSEGRIEAVGPLDEVTGRLDLRPLTGRYEAGGVIHATVQAQDKRYGLTELAFAGGRLTVPALDLEVGVPLRVRIRARDVALALDAPARTSFRNVVAGTVSDIGAETGPLVDVRLDAGGAALWARITQRSLDELGLRPGKPVYALIKAVTIDRTSLGRARRGRFLADQRDDSSDGVANSPDEPERSG